MRHEIVETCPRVWSVFAGDEAQPVAQFTDFESANLYAHMRNALMSIRDTTGEYRTDAFNAMADFAERHYREIAKATPGAKFARRAA